ncbi:MAG: AAA family ATPase [Bacteroidales bacterium]|jgi:DNA transposition AAA+ family ATPase|nr:AAA family ATPase [Bacteroidales bacterium]
MITNELKQKVVEGLRERRKNFAGSDSKFAVSICTSPSQLSRILKGELDRVISDAKWISLARMLDITLSNAPQWQPANTPVFAFIKEQMTLCQERSQSSLFCDKSDIGKTYTAMWYQKNNRNVVYIDCSQVKTKFALIRHIAQSFGTESKGRYAEVYNDLAYYIKTLDKPFIILDEAGDLTYEAFLEIKALWNATENACGWYMMGANGLKQKISRMINADKVGYEETYTRFGSRTIKLLPEAKAEKEKMLLATAAMIIKANAQAKDIDMNKIINSTRGDDYLPSLRRIYKAININ